MLHIHNGESTAGTLKEFGFPGEHFSFNEALVDGPTPGEVSTEEFLTIRARFLSSEDETEQKSCKDGLLRQLATLERSREHDEVVLWFEYDLFCQANLLYLLDWFARRKLGKTRLGMICIGEFEGIEDFRGLGQLTGEQMASLFDSREEVTSSQLDTATRAWSAYCSSDPRSLEQVVQSDLSALTFLKPALLLHLSRFPSSTNGLGRIENSILELIAQGSTTFRSLFPAFAKQESGFGFGDLQIWSELERLAGVKDPLIEISGNGVNESASSFHKASLSIMSAGEEIRASRRDFIDVNGIDLWLGGVHLTDENVWRWDQSKGALTR